LRTASDSVRRARPLLGTFVEISVAGAATCAMHAGVEAAFDAVAAVHNLMSFHDEASDVRRLNAQAWSRPIEVHAWTFQVIKAALDLHRRSAGAFDITVAPVLQDVGLLPLTRNGAALGRQARCAPTPLVGEGWGGGWCVCAGASPHDPHPQPHPTRGRGGLKFASSEAIELLPGRRVRFSHHGVKIDLGGIAKGFAVDRAVRVLQGHGMSRGLVNAGGDLAAFGPPEAVHVRDPRDPRRLLCCVVLRDGALASSGNSLDALQFTEVICSAIIDPSSGKPARGIAGATVHAPCCMLADALTKVVMVAGPSATALLEHYRAGALMVARDGTVQMTRDFESTVCRAA
jgi:thiamine biosynthesis lipoprotein